MAKLRIPDDLFAGVSSITPFKGFQFSTRQPPLVRKPHFNALPFIRSGF
jgi:hypothetical protein